MLLCFSGDPEASFTKEQMHAGKHQEYEKKLHEALLSKTQTASSAAAATATVATAAAPPSETKQPPTTKNKEGGGVAKQEQQTNKEGWPQLEKDKEAKKPEGKAKGGKNKTKAFTNSNNNNNVSKKSEKAVKSCERGCQNKTPEPKQESVVVVEKKEDTPPSEPPQQQQQQQQVENPTTTTKINSILDDNTSFFSQNTFHKLTLKEEEEELEGSSDSSPNTVGTVLSESLPDISSTEDWEAAFGFTKHSNHLEELAKQRNNVKGTLETFGNGFAATENYQQNILDALSNKNFLPTFKQQQNSPTEDRLHQHQYFSFLNHNHKEVNGLNGVSNGLKFFSDFYKNGTTNGYAEHQNYLMMHQRRQQIEEQLLSLNMHVKQGGSYGAPHLLQNGVNSSQFFNFDLYQTKPNNRTHAEDELDFDPFQETQKGLAELIENEQNHKMHSNTGWFVLYRGWWFFFNVACCLVRGNVVQINGMQGVGAQMPPPPPGFMQPSSTHMNSFGSKILPYLNMGSSNQSSHNGWPSGYSGNLPQQQHKGN